MKLEDRKARGRMKSDEGCTAARTCRERRRDEGRLGGGLIHLTLQWRRIKARVEEPIKNKTKKLQKCVLSVTEQTFRCALASTQNSPMMRTVDLISVF